MPDRDDIFDEAFLARLRRLRLIAKRLASRQQPGLRRSRRVGDGLEFADHRDYAPGDDLRFIDWPYYARMEKLLLRLFHEHSEADVAILLDTSASMAPGNGVEKFHYALRASAALAFLAMGGFDRVILQPFSDDLRPPLQCGRTKENILQVLDYLAAQEPGGTTNLTRSADRFARTLSEGATVLLVSDLLGCGNQLSDALAGLKARRADVTALHVYARADAAPDLHGPTLLEDAETGDRMTLEVSDELLAAYRRRWDAMQKALARACRSRGARFVAAATDEPLEQLVLTSLRRAGVLAG
ncbi:MAG: DUF58 domain-containing protein [Phycisphaerae bacterium]